MYGSFSSAMIRQRINSYRSKKNIIFSKIPNLPQIRWVQYYFIQKAVTSHWSSLLLQPKLAAKSFIFINPLYYFRYLFKFIIFLFSQNNYPWKKILTSKACWAVINERFVEAWSISFALECLPLYVKGNKLIGLVGCSKQRINRNYECKYRYTCPH